jgi:hypothetical protein
MKTINLHIPLAVIDRVVEAADRAEQARAI